MAYELLKRLVGFLATLLAAVLVVFLVLEVLPGDPAAVMLGPDATPEMIASLRAELGLDQPAIWRFLHWLGSMATGDFGISYSYRVPVSGLILDRLAVTLPLSLMAIVLTTVLAMLIGVYAAANSNRLSGHLAMGLTQIGIAIPSFWLGLVLVLIFSVGLRWFPSNGFPGWRNGLWPAIHALILPAVALAVVQAAVLARVTRASLLEVLRDDFTRTARSKGLTRRQMLWKHALQNALIPIATMMGLQFAQLMAGTIVIESVFALPGLGNLIFQAVGQRDLVVIRSVVVVLAAMVIAINFIVDIAYVLIDPRLRVQA
ncbi:ABC transporter permease [Enterovirga sp.]|uniref:ABC transporter permease n=1 Tax=Enterovirga sp. TaxID=2026350 RepID=UPI002C144710|nr:ABC transporter permease [Enterovirga sp.]HMO27709.1 ABC transporter permease [Enterovirga sp.]